MSNDHANSHGKTILMIGFDFPPSNRAAVQRNMTHAYHLQSLGWKTIFLSVSEKCYSPVDRKPLEFAELSNIIHRTGAVDSRKIFGFRDKFIDVLSLPDEWISWFFTAVPKALKLIREHHPDVIWSTYPICTAHLIGLTLKRLTDLPWIADFQDPVANMPGISDVSGLDWSMKKLDKAVVNRADLVVLATESSRQHYIDHYQITSTEKFITIENGYYDLPNIDRNFSTHPTSSELGEKTRLLYSGTIYGAGRNPNALFKALQQLKTAGTICADNFELVFQGYTLKSVLSELAKSHDLIDLLTFQDPVPFGQSLRSMSEADALVLIQGEEYNLQIPGKIYEYIAAKKPILGICHPLGATHALIEKIPSAISGWSTADIAQMIKILIEGNLKMPEYFEIQQYSRYQKTVELKDATEKLLFKNRV